jgi:heme/copper-type cytochrome/quinol oxidase subunit 1
MSELFPDTGNSLRSWLLTRDTGRQALLFLASTTLFFAVGAALAIVIHFELLTPSADRVSAETYGVLFTMHGLFMMHLFLLPALFGVLGNLSISASDHGKAVFPQLGLLGWYLHLSGGVVLLWVLASGGVATGFAFGYVPVAESGLVTVVQLATALAVAGVLLTGLNLAIAAGRKKNRWAGFLQGEGASYTRAGMTVAAIGALLAIMLIVWRGWGPLQGTYFEVGSRHLLLGGVGLGVYFGRLTTARGTAPAAIAIFAGLLLMCIPQLAMGALEVPRRYNEYSASLQLWQVISSMGGFTVVVGCCLAFWSVFAGRRPTDSP